MGLPILDHLKDAVKHITGAERTAWNAKEPAITKATAFNKAFETTATNIKMNGTQAVGTADTLARADHVHPIDTSRAAASEAKLKKIGSYTLAAGGGLGIPVDLTTYSEVIVYFRPTGAFVSNAANRATVQIGTTTPSTTLYNAAYKDLLTGTTGNSTTGCSLINSYGVIRFYPNLDSPDGAKCVGFEIKGAYPTYQSTAGYFLGNNPNDFSIIAVNAACYAEIFGILK